MHSTEGTKRRGELPVSSATESRWLDAAGRHASRFVPQSLSPTSRLASGFLRATVQVMAGTLLDLFDREQSQAFHGHNITTRKKP